jgi:hypothetical protein
VDVVVSPPPGELKRRKEYGMSLLADPEDAMVPARRAPRPRLNTRRLAAAAAVLGAGTAVGVDVAPAFAGNVSTFVNGAAHGTYYGHYWHHLSNVTAASSKSYYPYAGYCISGNCYDTAVYRGWAFWNLNPRKWAYAIASYPGATTGRATASYSPN